MTKKRHNANRCSTFTRLRRELLKINDVCKKVRSHQTTTSQPYSCQFSGPVSACVFVFPSWGVACVQSNLVKMAQPACDLALQSRKTCWKHWSFKFVCFYTKRLGLDCPTGKRSKSVDPRKQQERFQSKEKMKKKGSEVAGGPKRTSPAQENDSAP